MLPLCRHFSRVCHSSSQPAFQAAHPWLQGTHPGRGSSAGPSRSDAPQPSTGYWDGLSPLLQSQHTPRSPSLGNSGQTRPWICVDPSDWGTGSWLVQTREHPGEESCSKLHPAQPSPLPTYSSTRAGARHPVLLLPGLGTSTPSPLGPRRWPRFSPTNLWRSAAGSTGALHWRLPLERDKTRPRKAMELGERPSGLDTRCSLHTIGDPKHLQGLAHILPALLSFSAGMQECRTFLINRKLLISKACFAHLISSGLVPICPQVCPVLGTGMNLHFTLPTSNVICSFRV